MKTKKAFLGMFFTVGSLLYGQVGINTQTPQSTLDVVGNGSSVSAKDGLTAPRLTKQQLAAKTTGTYASEQTGAIVYVTDAANPSGTIPSVSQTLEITTTGYYFFNGSIWKKMSDTAVNIYNSDGTLTGDRLVSQDGKALNFDGKVIVGSTTNNTNDKSKLHIFSSDATTSLGSGMSSMFGRGLAITTDTSTRLYLENTASATDQKVFQIKNENGLFSINPLKDDASATVPAAGAAAAIGVTSSGNVGIGVDSPEQKLHVEGNARITGSTGTPTKVTGRDDSGDIGDITIGSGLTLSSGTLSANAAPAAVNIYNSDGSLEGNRVVTQGNNTLSFNSTATNGFSVDGSTFSVDAANNNVGIGTNAPAQKLHVEGSARITGSTGTPIKVTGRDANGNIGDITIGSGLTMSSGTLSANAAPAAVNIYNSNGTLTGNRLVSQDGKALNFDGKVIVGSTTNNTNDKSKLHIFSSDATTSLGSGMSSMFGRGLAITTDTSTRLYLENTASATDQKVFQIKNENGLFSINPLKDDASATVPTAGAAAAIGVTSSGNVGIGVDSPAQKFHVAGNARITGSTGTPTKVTGRDANGDIGDIAIGSGLTLSSGTLSANATPAAVNIYNSNGSLAGNRVVTQGSNTLSFNSTATNGFSVDGSTFSVDAANDRVGIGTATPSAKLHVNGNMVLGTASGTNGSSNFSTVVRDNTSGELKTVISNTGNSKPINYVKYILNKVQGDFVNDYDTKIDATIYTVSIIGNNFSSENAPGQLTFTGALETNKPTFSPTNVYAFKSGGTWHISADYPNSTTTNIINADGSVSSTKVNGTWNIYCLIINNSLVQNLPDVTESFNGQSTKTAATSPAGL